MRPPLADATPPDADAIARDLADIAAATGLTLRMSPTGARSDAHLRTGSPLRVVPAATGRVQTP